MPRPLTTLLLALFFGGVLAVASSPSWADDKTTEEVEEVEEVEVEEAKVEPGRRAGSSRGLSDSLGRFHPFVVHFPIAWLFLLLLVDLGGVVLQRGEGLSRAGKWLLGLTALSLVSAVVTGLLRASTSELPAAELGRVELHRNWAFVTLGLVVLALLLLVVRRNCLAGLWRWLYMLLVVAAVTTMGIAGHLGGVLVFGENYLPF